MTFAYFLVLFSVPAGFIASDLRPGQLYIADTGAGKIWRFNLGSSSLEQVVAGLASPVGIAVNVEASHVYWTDASTHKIQRANLNGTDIVDLVTLPDGSPAGIALDTVAGKMYWADSSIASPRIQRANLDGSGAETFISTGLQVVHGVCVHRHGGGTGLHRVYWSDSFARKIRSANLQGTDLYDHVSMDIGIPRGLLWDWQSSKLVWTDTFADKIQRSKFYNGKAETIVSAGLSQPEDVAIDEDQLKLYWTDSETRKIQRSDLDGGRVEDIIISGLVSPAGIAVVPAETTTTTRTTTTATTTTSTSTTSTSTTSTSTTSTSTGVVESSTTTIVPIFDDSNTAMSQASKPQITTTATQWQRKRPDALRTGAPSSSRQPVPSLQICILVATAVSAFIAAS